MTTAPPPAPIPPAGTTRSSVSGTATTVPAPPPRARLRRGATLGVASVASFMVALDLLVITTALDTIHRELGTSTSALQWTLTAYSISFAALLMTGAALGDRFGRRRMLATGLGVFVAGCAAAALSLAWLALVAAPDLAYTVMVVPLVVAGAGCSAALPVSQAVVVGAVRDAEVGKAAGTNNMLQELGGAFGVAVAVALFAGTGSYASAQDFTDGFGPAIGICAVLSLLALVAALALPRRVRASAHESTPQGSEQPVPDAADVR